MANSSNDSGVNLLQTTCSPALRWCGVVFAMVLPTLITWAYFVLADQFSTVVQQSVYLLVKVVQFGFPIFWTAFILRERLRTGKATAHGLLLGAAFGAGVVAAGWVVFEYVLRDSRYFSSAAKLVDEKISGFGVDSFWKYVALGIFYSVFHSLLEEYYWRWFVFRQLRGLVAIWPAIIVSSLAFMAHHVVLLSIFFKDAQWLAWLLSFAVAIGGIFWAWLYNRTNSLLAPWLSHMVIDAGIFWIGYELVQTSLVG